MTMMREDDIVLELERVCRVFPRDISDIPATIVREMLCPRSLLNPSRPDTFFALRDVSIRLRRGQKLGVIGGHRSGKSVLAGIASGVLMPTQGQVRATSSRLLFSRPTAGFKMSLSLRENLAFRGILAGLLGDVLTNAVESVLQINRLEKKVADSPLGNLSPYLVRKLGMELLLQVPAEILVIDELVGAGAGEDRWATRAALIERLGAGSALVVSADLEFLKEVADQSLVLLQGGLHGPFATELAFEYFLRHASGTAIGGDATLLPGDPDSQEEAGEGVLNVLGDEGAMAFRNIDDFEASAPDEEGFQRRGVKQAARHGTVVTRIVVDGEEYERAKLRLLRRPGETLEVSVDLLPSERCTCEGLRLSLYSGTGMEVGNTIHEIQSVDLHQGRPSRIRFDLQVPNLPRGHYGLAIDIVKSGANSSGSRPLKLVVFGLLTDVPKEAALSLEVTGLSIESNQSYEASDIS